MKIKFINYKPYEYELLHDQLNQLGKQGYTTNDLSFITFFRKKDKPVYYTIDFFNPIGSSRNDKKASQFTFIDKYENRGYHCVYHKNNMYVFVSNEDKPIHIQWQDKKDIITFKLRLKSFALFFISIVALALYSVYLSQTTFDTFYSYGITLYYIGIALLLIVASLKNYFDFHKLTQFYHQLQAGKPQLKKAPKLKKTYHILLIIICLLVGGGLLEDFINNQTFHVEEHQIIQLEDFGYSQETTLSTQSYSSFTIPHTYISLEGNETTDEALYIKEFVFHSPEKAQKIFNQMKENPQIYSCNNQKSDNSMIQGYIDNTLISIVVLHNQNITIIIPSFELNDSHIQTIQDFYLK